MKLLVKFLFLIFVFNSIFKLNAQSTIDLYRATTPPRVYNNIQLLTQQDKLYTIENQFPEIAIMIKRFVTPNPDFTFQSPIKLKTVKFSNYSNDIADCIKSMDINRQIEALASLVYFGELLELKPILDKLLNQVKGTRYQYIKALEDVVTIQAASGFSELAEEQLNAMKNVISGVNAEMHLAIKYARLSNFVMAENYARSSLNNSKDDLYTYERNRIFFQLCKNLGERRQIELAKELALLLNTEPNRAVAYGFIAKGADNASLLKEAMTMTSHFEANKKNYVLKELGVLAAQMNQKELAFECQYLMNMTNLKQNAVRVLCEIANVYKDVRTLNRAYSITRQIPNKVSIAKSDAIIWTANSEVLINKNPLEETLNKVIKLEPNYQIKFDMGLLKIPSQRYYYKDSGY
ncbi:hypothetical protein [Winogradskyella psychrotolerans]|uniref:hypothetical protein n=1 Tax=Winogradskyella psychrotolerans TaxID=1344585 RepID=UPI001C07C77E|nr:hypothetical protein [Winogradskyella psychrotolerans]MBU2929630.1 hypothetical protein [Winogradskyella psychrotolerans]